jgi:hypothetical protein
MKIKGLISEKTVVLKYDGQEINIQRSQDEKIFLKISQLLIDGKQEELISEFLDIKAKIENFSENTFTVKDQKIVLKDDSTAIPQAIAKKLLEMEKEGEDFLPLIRFWKKLRKNPSKNSREQLYGFMLANDIALTVLGDIVVEKGVRQKYQGLPGELVDCHSRSVDNSVGMIVEMPREKVNDDPAQTCSYGLHVGAPKYVRQWYSSDIIVDCIVNPVDIVSVPKDYNNTKMRVCRYQVMGYSDKSRNPKRIVNLNEFLKTPTEEAKKTINTQIKADKGSSHKADNDKVKSVKQSVNVEQNPYMNEIEGKTAKQIIEYVLQKTGVNVEGSLKNKSSIVNKAVRILELKDTDYKDQDVIQDQKALPSNCHAVKQVEDQGKFVDLTKYSKDKKHRKELIELIKSKFNEQVSKFAPTKSIVKKARELYTEAGYEVKG